MITSLRLKDFKNFADETLRVGPFTVIVGANASGKSNIRDAFRFLHGVGRGYTLAEIIGGKLGAGTQVEWEPIRGAANEIIRIEKSTNRIPRPPLPAFGLEVGLTERTTKTQSIRVEVSREITRSKGFRITLRTTADRRRGGLREAEEPIRRTPDFPWARWRNRYQARQAGSDPSAR